MTNKTKSIVYSSFFLALGIMIPYIFHLTGLAGPIFLPMHLPVLLCGFILGERYGLLVGFITPLLNSFLTGMPTIFPIGISMAFELAAYGFLSGYLYKNKKFKLLLSLIIAMIFGRFISGVSNYLLLTSVRRTFMLNAFLTSSFVKAIWGILIQIIVIPMAVKSYEKFKGVS